MSTNLSTPNTPFEVELLDERIYQLERDAQIAEFYHMENRREWSIVLIFVQIGLVISGAIYFGLQLGLFPQALFEHAESLAGYAIGAITLTLLANSILGGLQLRRTRKVPFHPAQHSELAE